MERVRVVQADAHVDFQRPAVTKKVLFWIMGSLASFAVGKSI